MKVNYSSNQILLSSSELKFGFLASSVINNLESDNYQIRLATIKDLIATVQTTAPSKIDVDRFLDFIVQFLDDDNIMIAEKSCTVIESLCYNLYGNAALYKNHILKIAVSNLGVKKKFLTLFAQKILHIMIKSISPQIILSDVFSMTLLAPPRTLTYLFNFIASEIKTDIIPPSILTKYAFILEDALNSDDKNLVESTQNCLQEIKIKDLYTYEAIAQRIKIAYINSTSIQNPTTNNNNNKGLGFKTQTYNNLSYINSSSSDYKQPFLSPINQHYNKMNRSFVSNATFALAEEDNIEVSTSKPGSADDSRFQSAKANIGNANDFDIPQIFDGLDFNNDQINHENYSRKTFNFINDQEILIDKSQISKSTSNPKKRLLTIHTPKS